MYSSMYILNHGNRWWWVVSFTPWPLYPRENSLHYLQDKRLDRVQSWTVFYRNQKNLLLLPVIEPKILGPQNHLTVNCYTHWDIPAPLDTEKKKMSAPAGNWKLNHQAHSLVTILAELTWIKDSRIIIKEENKGACEETVVEGRNTMRSWTKTDICSYSAWPRSLMGARIKKN
jgi:hypothetical protein